jgi:hypothetical protein
MAFNGSGTFNRIYNWVNDKANGFKIMASRMDNEFDGIATGLSQCITKDGQTTISANIPMANYKFTGLGNGTTRTDSIALGQVQDGQFTYLGTTGGTADAYTLTPSPSITAYATTQQFTAKISATNTTTTPYLQISGIANPTTTAVIKKLSATKTEIAVSIGDLVANGIYTFQRNSANDAWILLTPNIATTTNQGVAYLNNPITIANNATNPNTQMDIGAGIVDYNNGSGQLLCQAMTKTLQSSGSWTAGTNQNGLDTGARANSTWYNIFQIVKNTDNTSDILYSTSRTAPNVPSGYTLVAWIGRMRTDASGNIDPNQYSIRTSYGQLHHYRNPNFASGTTTIPFDNTTPQNTEGTEFMTTNFVPIKAFSKIEIDCNMFVAISVGNVANLNALFKSGNANALTVGFCLSSSGDGGQQTTLKYVDTLSSTSAVDYSVRCGGSSASTCYFNGISSGARFNGTFYSSITIKEYL